MWETFEADAVLDQATPVQNTWYTVCNLADCIINAIIFKVATTGETLEVETTRDGVVVNGSIAAAANTYYAAGKDPTGTTSLTIYSMSTPATAQTYDIIALKSFKCKSFQMRLRKTTAAGTGNLYGKVSYGVVS